MHRAKDNVTHEDLLLVVLEYSKPTSDIEKRGIPFLLSSSATSWPPGVFPGFAVEPRAVSAAAATWPEEQQPAAEKKMRSSLKTMRLIRESRVSHRGALISLHCEGKQVNTSLKGCKNTGDATSNSSCLSTAGVQVLCNIHLGPTMQGMQKKQSEPVDKAAH